MSSRVCVLGLGAWGTSLAKALAEKGGEVVIWGRNPRDVADVNEKHENVHYLPKASLPANLRATTDLAGALDGAEMVVFVAPSHATREVAKLAGLNATLEHAAERPKNSDAESLAKRLLKKADDVRSKAPHAAQMAQEWAAVYADGWK